MSDKNSRLKILRINVANQTVREEPVPMPLMPLGGRSFTSHWVSTHVDPESDPLGRKNQLVIAPGLLAGTPASSVHRLSVGAKSPLTNGIKESNSGGNVAYKLARLGIKAIILEGVPKENEWRTIRIAPQGVSFESAADLLGKGTEECAAKTHAHYGMNAALMVLGPAGENCLNTAAIANSDREGFPARFSGRGGMGAVMGSKGIKAIVIDDSGTKAVTLADEAKFRRATRDYHRCVKETPQTSEIYTKFGTAAMVDVTNELGGLPTRNFSCGRFEGAESINGRTIYQTIVQRGGDPSHACMPGCLIRSSNIYVEQDGQPIVRSLEYETLAMLGPNCAIDDLDELARINRLCNDIGVDSIDMGGAIGIAMEAGVIPFGDIAGVKRLLLEVYKGTFLSRLLCQGGAITGKVLGVRRIPAVKGQIMAAYEPRAIKGHGVTFATATMGADHTAGFTIREGLSSHDKDGQVKASGRMQVNGMIYDSLGVCLFAHVAIRNHHQILAELVNGRWGTSLTALDLRNMAIQSLQEEREFNRQAGLGPSSDRLPGVFYEEVNPSSGTSFDISPSELDELKYV
jgi:aldehyde:ferredoxin oxidoreductase